MTVDEVFSRNTVDIVVVSNVMFLFESKDTQPDSELNSITYDLSDVGQVAQ